jgi:release factor glutamine methyltransferase
MAVTIGELLIHLASQLHRTSETARLDAQVLIAHFTGQSRSWVMAHPEAIVKPAQYERISQAAQQLLQGQPLPYLIGHWEFYGTDFDLSPDVLIPRPETELLVERAIHWLRLHPTRRKVVDIGTGSGCLGLSLARYIPDLQLIMTDISPEALQIARINAQKHGFTQDIEFRQADLLTGIDQPFDMMCANLPYIPTSLLQTLPAAKQEPLQALNGGPHGTRLIRRLLQQARNLLISGGLLLLEIEASQGEAVKSMAQASFALSKVNLLQDLAGHDRCVEIERPNLIVHLCHRQEWQEAQPIGEFRSASLDSEGFIHCSQPEEIHIVANRFYQGIPDLILLWLNPEIVSSEIRWEGVGGVQFPHIYGPVNLEAVVSAGSLNPGPGGEYRPICLPT